MPKAEVTSGNVRNIPRFRWRLIPAAFFGISGFVTTGYGMYGVGYLTWLTTTGGRRVLWAEPIPATILIVLGIVWIVSARQFMKSRWLWAILTASIPPVLWNGYVEFLLRGL